LRRTILVSFLFLVVILAGLWVSASASWEPSGAVPGYSLRKLVPKGFSVYQGILDWVPVSSTLGIAFARNYDKIADVYSLASYSFSKTGVCSSSRTIATGKGSPRGAACFWITDGVSGERAASAYGLVFVLFNEAYSNYEAAAVYVAKFDSSGGVSGRWKQIFREVTPKGWYIYAKSLFAFRGGQSIGIVPSLTFRKIQQTGQRSLAYFLEADIKDGSLIGSTKQLPLPIQGHSYSVRGFAPGWNGTSWLVPVAATMSKSGAATEDDILGNKALVCVVSGKATHAAVLSEIAEDALMSRDTYELALTSYPGSSTDMSMFVRHRTPLQESQRKLDMFKYDFSLKRLDVRGRLVTTRSVSIAAPVHKLAYDVAYEPWLEDDSWSECLVRSGTIYLARAHSVVMIKKHAWAMKYEQEFDFYAINSLTGDVSHKARTVATWDLILLLKPWIDSFPGGPIAVVNYAYFMTAPYARDNFLTLFNF